MRQFIIIMVGLALLSCSSIAVDKTIKSARVDIGEEFEIKNISGANTTVMIIEKDGKHYIRSNYHHGWTTEQRDYHIPVKIQSVFIRDRAIYLSYADRPKGKLIGLVYVINNHGEAIKVDDITAVDLTY